MELNKYFSGKTIEVLRSEIKFSDYNPRIIDDEGRKQLKKSIKTYGIVGGIVVNTQTGNTIVGGHQKVAILDELNKFPTKDYKLKVEMIDVDLKTEKQLNLILNNPNVGGRWDYDALARLIPDIDYKAAGLTDSDLNMIGIDFLLETEGENDMIGALNEMMLPVIEQRETQKTQRAAERAFERESKVQHMRDVKAQVRENAQKQVEQMEAYIMLSFDSFAAKKAFCERFGYDGYTKFIKGEIFDEQIERLE